MTEIYLCW